MTASVNSTVESWPIDQVIPYEKNAKIHDPNQVSKIARSIQEFGWDQPIVVDKDGVIIKGHGRRMAAIKLGMTHVPVVVRKDLTVEQAKAARLADNRVAEGDVDPELLQAELRDLSAFDGIDLGSLGFDERELEFLTADLSDMNVDALVENLDEEVNEQTERVENKVEEAKNREVKLAEAFGFPTLSVEQARTVSKFMAQVEADSGKEGADALIDFMEKLATAWE